MKIFVYGTLKQGYGNHEYLLHGKPGVQFLGPATTVDFFHMRDCGFPVVLQEGDPLLPVSGEVFDVPTEILGPLDRLEANGLMYERDVRPVKMVDGQVQEAWIYIGVPEHWQGYQRLPVAPVNDRAAWEWGR